MKKPTISDLALAAGVSKTTVSHAFSGRRHVDPETRKRIEDIAQTIGYRPNRAAQTLRTGRTGVLALASSMPFSVAAGTSRLGFLMEIAATAAVASLTRDMALCLIPPLQSDSPTKAIIPDGVIVVEPFENDPLVAHFRAAGVPMVSIGRVPGAADIPFVDLCSAATARLVLDHLHSVGARRIGLVTGAQRRNSYIETEAVYRALCRESGMTEVMVQLDEAGGEVLAETEIGALLDANPDVDALYVPVDAFATGAVAAAHARGFALPSRLALATRYDGLRAQLSQPPLTAVNLHLEDIADRAVSLLIAGLEDAPPPPAPAFRPTLVARASTVGAG